MHIIALFTALLGALGVFLWRLNMAADAAKGLAETANDAHGLFRRWGWRKKFANDPYELIQDPREAAAAMMVAIAQADGAMTERERRTILAQMVQRMGANGGQAEELLAHGRWLSREVKDPARALLKLVPMLKKTCDDAQIKDIIEMLREVSHAEGSPGAEVQDAIGRFSQAILQKR